MLVTITNSHGAAINNLQTYNSATGGVREHALPHPFGWIGTLAAAGTRQLAMHPSDLYCKSSMNASQCAWEQFQQQIQQGTISVAIADQGSANGVRAFDELFFIEV